MDHAPIFQKARKLGLQAHKTDINVECVTTQGIPVGVRAVIVYKVGDDLASIANAARRFLDREQEMDGNVHEVFAGHVRSIVGSMTVEDIIRNRSELATQTRESSSTEMSRLGLVIDSLQIQEFDDPTKYIENLAKPHKARVESEARIAEAQRVQEAVEKEQASAAIAAQGCFGESEIQQADLRARSQEARSEGRPSRSTRRGAGDAWRLSSRRRSVSELEAKRREQQLQVEVVKPAQADRDAQIAKAEADRQRTELAAQADAAATRVKLGSSESDGADGHERRARRPRLA
jgi:flotillin